MTRHIPLAKPSHTSSFGRNIALNFLGQIVPLLAAFFAIPTLIGGLGTDRFGILTLAWMVIGYFSLFDLGLGRALTQLVAEKLGSGEEEQIPELAWTALALMFILGLIGSLVFFLISPWLVDSVLKIPKLLQGETLRSFYLLAVSIPIVISTAGLSGILTAKQLFGILNIIRIPLGIVNFVAPLAVLPFSHSLVPVIAILLSARVLGLVVHFYVCLSVMPALRSNFTIKRAAIYPLFRFGSWMTVTNVIGPFLIYIDRFVIGAVLSVTAVAFYATPYEMVTKLLVIPVAIVGVLFPAFASSYRQNANSALLLFVRGTKYIALALFPVVLFVIAFANEGLQWWLGGEFGLQSTPVLQWLAIGIFANSLAFVPFAFIQGIGRPDMTAKLHLIELPLYLVVLWWCMRSYGITGASIAWTVRVVIDGFLLFLLTTKFFSGHSNVFKKMALSITCAMAALFFMLIPTRLENKILLCISVMILFISIGWLKILNTQERIAVKNRIGSFF